MKKHKNIAMGAFLMFPFFSILIYIFKYIINKIFNILNNGFEPYILKKHFLSKSRYCAYSEIGANPHDFLLYCAILVFGIYGFIKLKKDRLNLLNILFFGFFVIQAFGLFLISLSQLKIEYFYYVSFFTPFKEVFLASTFLGLPYYALSLVSTLFLVFAIYHFTKKKYFSLQSLFLLFFFFSAGVLSYYVFIHFLVRMI